MRPRDYLLMMKKSVLITGAAGFIGSRLADWILENRPEYEVVGIDNLFGGYMENVDDRVVFYKRDLSCDLIDDIFRKHEFEYVFHMACYAAEGLSPFMRMFNDRNNMLATDNIINECAMHGVKRLVYTSSMSVYGWGETKGRLFNENDTPAPIDPYAVSKYACELNVKNAGETHGLDWCIIRPHNVAGIKQNIWDKYRNVLGIWMYAMKRDEPMLIYGTGEQTRAFTCVDDCLEPFWKAATEDETSKEIINLGGMKGYTIKEAAETLCKVAGYDRLEYREPRHEVKYAIPDPRKSIELLDYKELKPFEEWLADMWEWAKKQPDRPQYKWENYEITKGIYGYWK